MKRLLPAQQTKYEVICGEKRGVLDTSRLGSGTKGRCIQHDDKWYTPRDFEASTAMNRVRDWRRSIRMNRFPLRHHINSGTLRFHDLKCICKNCGGLEGNPILYENHGPPVVNSVPVVSSTPSFTPSQPLVSSVPISVPSQPLESDVVSSTVTDTTLREEDVNKLIDLVKKELMNTPILPSSEGPVSMIPSSVANGRQVIDIPSSPERETRERERESSIVALVDSMTAKIETIEETVNTLNSAVCSLKSELASIRVLASQPLASPPPEKRARSDPLDGGCARCGRPAPYKCAGCSSVKYCSADCQSRHWLTHEVECGTSNAKIIEEEIVHVDGPDD